MVESLCLLVSLILGPAGGDKALADLRVLALSPASAAAVVEVEGEAEGGELDVVHPGDEIGTTDLVVVGVFPDRLEVRMTVPAGPRTPPVRRRYWIYRAEGATPSRAQPIDLAPPPSDRVGSSPVSPALRDPAPRDRSRRASPSRSVRSPGTAPPGETEASPDLPPPAESSGEPAGESA